MDTDCGNISTYIVHKYQLWIPQGFCDLFVKSTYLVNTYIWILLPFRKRYLVKPAIGIPDGSCRLDDVEILARTQGRLDLHQFIVLSLNSDRLGFRNFCLKGR